MKLMEYFLIQKITNRINKSIADKAAQESVNQVENGKVQPISIYGKVFWVCGLAGIIFGGLACIFNQPVAGFWLFSLFALISIPGLCIRYNCLLTYDEEGFTWRNMLRISHHYSYEEVTGLYSSPLHVVVEINNQKQLDLDKDWMNQNNFAKAIRKYRSEKPPKLPMPVLGMSETEISASYECGVLSRAMLVKKKDLPKFVWFKWIHYGIGILSGLFTVFAMLCFPVLRDMEMLPCFLIFVLPEILCMVTALFLYFQYPQYFTAREKPNNVTLFKKTKANHKCCTLALTSTLGVLGAGLFFLNQLQQQTIHSFLLLLAAILSVILFWVLLAVFRRFSWEYRNFRVGYVTFTFWQVFFCLSVFFILGGLLLKVEGSI